MAVRERPVETLNIPHLLVIGGSGFIGHHLLKASLQKEWQVSSVSLNHPTKERFVDGVRYLQLDLTDRLLVKELLGEDFDYVVNLGGYINHKLFKDGGRNLIDKHHIERFEYQLPDEYRLDIQLKEICDSINIASSNCDTEHFYTSRYELKNFFSNRKQVIMESFYRMMRKKHDIMMVSGQPEGGKWNYDQSNRKKWPGKPEIPHERGFRKNVEEVLEDLKKANIETFGHIEPSSFNWPTSRADCLAVLNYFCKNLLKHFGDYQDAMHTDQKFLFHSRVSFAMNSKLLSPKEVIAITVGEEKAQEAVRKALAVGADRGIHVKTDSLIEPLNVAKILKKIIEKEKPDIVFMGKQAIDDDCNQTGQMLSAMLGWSQGTFASKIELKDKSMQVTREVDEGLETIEINLPAIVTCDLRLNEPRYASLPNIMKAKKKPIEQLIAKDLGVDISNRIQQLKVEEPPKRKGGIKVANVAELVSKLKNEAKVI